MSDRPTTADELRRAFVDFFDGARPRRGPVGERDPGRQDAAVHRRGHGPVQELLHRRGDAAVPARGLGRRSACAPAASTTTSTTSAARTATSRSSRCSATSASATTSRPRRSASRGSSTREVLQLDTEPAVGHRHEDDDEAERIWRDDDRLPGRPDPAARRGQLLEHGRHRPVRPVVGDLLGPRPRARSRRWSRSPTATATSRSGTSCS